MLKKLLFLSIFQFFLYSQDYMLINSFEIDVMNREGKAVLIETSFRIEGRDLAEEKYKIMDSLHIVIGGYTLDDLITSRGKRWLKAEFKKMMDKEYGIDIEAIYISKFKVKNKSSKPVKSTRYDDTEIKELIQLLKSNQCLKNNIVQREAREVKTKSIKETKTPLKAEKEIKQEIKKEL
jgi:hypothetical protein